MGGQLGKEKDNYFNEEFVNEVSFQEDVLRKLSKNQANDYPHNCIGPIMFRNKFKVIGLGTGFLISSDLVLTVAHNIFKHGATEHYNQHVFYPGISCPYKDYEEPSGFRVIAYRFPKEYESAVGYQDKEHDYALMKLEKPIKREKYIELGLGYKMADDQISLFGYNRGSVYVNDAFQVGLAKKSSHSIYSDIFVKHHISTEGGNSGSPLFVEREGKILAVAIHQGGIKNENVNISRAITSELLKSLWVWEKEMNKSQIKFSLMEENQQISAMEQQKWMGLNAYKLDIVFQPLSSNQPYYLSWDTKTPVASKFVIQGFRAKLIEENWYQITSHALPNSGRVTATFRVIQNSYAVHLGIITESKKRDDYSNGVQNEVLAYETYNLYSNGNIWMDNVVMIPSDHDLFVPNGGQLLVDVDLDLMEVHFINKSNGKEWRVKLSPLFQGKKLYFFATLGKVGDHVSML